METDRLINNFNFVSSHRKQTLLISDFNGFYNSPTTYMAYAATVPGYQTMPGFFIPPWTSNPSSDTDLDGWDGVGRFIGGKQL
jgi:hypothetical protein